jgi:hypothetical protein
MDTMVARRDHGLTRANDRHARYPAITDWTLLFGVLVCHE